MIDPDPSALTPRHADPVDVSSVAQPLAEARTQLRVRAWRARAAETRSGLREPARAQVRS